ncbi:MAG: S16 family serine protease [Ilumatobacteraceae bacterium]
MKFPVLFASGEGGGFAYDTVEVGPSPDDKMRVEFSEDEVTGLGPMLRAAMWNSAALSLLLSGESPTKEFRFTVSGLADGPSSGAVTTVAALAFMRGDKILEKVAMTGTIQPDGSVGPVGGIPEKVKGAAEGKFTKVGIPIGLRNTESAATGETVDVVALGRELGVEVVELSNVYEAYEFMTGKQLPSVPTGSNVKLDGTSYDRIKAKTSLMLANYAETANDSKKLSDLTRGLLASLIQEAEDARSRAEDLLGQGQVAGAYSSAVLAWGYGRAVGATGEVIDAILFDSTDSAFSLVAGSRVVVDKVYALFDVLKTFAPKSPSDASALMTAFASAIDALSLVDFAETEINGVAARLESGDVSKDDAVAELILPLVYNEFAAVQAESTRELFDAGRDLGAGDIVAGNQVEALAALLRKGADANMEAFQTQIVDELAAQFDRSSPTVLALVADKDLDVALANNQQAILDSVVKYLGKSDATQYAILGYGINNYSRSAQILLKYASNGVWDGNFELTGVKSEAALTAALDLGKSHLASNINMLRGKSIEPANEVGLYEAAAIDREGSVADKVSALGKYWSGYLGARVLAYLGGLEKEGLGG